MIRRNRLALLAGLTTLFLAAGSGAAYAWWVTSATVGSTATAASVGVTHALSGSTLDVIYDNSTNVTTAVGVVTITNTGSRDGTYSLAISATSASATLRSAVTVEVGTTASCTTAAILSGAVTGTFAATVTKTGAVAAGASVVLCVRTSMTAANITTNGTASLAATIASSIVIGTWSATASPAVTFTQSVAATTLVETGPWYWIKKFQVSPERCAEADNAGTTAGTAVSTGSCGTAAQAASNLNEFWRFVPTSSGHYRIVNRNAPTLWWSVPSATTGQPLQITAGTTTSQEWLPVLNSNGSYAFKLRANTALCAQSSGNGNGVAMTATTCVSGSTAQSFILTKYLTITPATIALTCASTGTTATYSWPTLTGYDTEVIYRVLLNGVVDTVYTGATGADTNARFASTATAAAYPVGTYSVEVQSSVAGSGWWSVGTGTLVIRATAPILSCT